MHSSQRCLEHSCSLGTYCKFSRQVPDKQRTLLGDHGAYLCSPLIAGSGPQPCFRIYPHSNTTTGGSATLGSPGCAKPRIRLRSCGLALRGLVVFAHTPSGLTRFSIGARKITVQSVPEASRRTTIPHKVVVSACKNPCYSFILKTELNTIFFSEPQLS